MKENTIYKEVQPLAQTLFPELRATQAVAVYLLALNGHSQTGNLLKIASATVSHHINIAKHILKVNTAQELKLITLTRLSLINQTALRG